MCFFCTRGLGSLGQESDVFQTRAVQKPRPSMAISGWSICRIMLGRRAISLKASWCLLGLSLGEVRSALANYLCAMLMDTRNTGDPVGWYSEITEFVQMFPFYPFPPIRGGMAVQQVTTNGIAFRIALQYLRITKGAWHFGSILRRWHIWKLLALQPHKDLDRGWSIGPEPAENHPPGLWRLCQWRRQPSSFGARWDSATGRSTSAEFGHVSSPILHGWPDPHETFFIETLTLQMLGLPVLSSFLFTWPHYNSFWMIGFCIMEAIDWTISRHFTCICSSFWKRCWNLKPGKYAALYEEVTRKGWTGGRF